MHQVTMCHRSKSFSRNGIIMNFGLRRLCSLLRRIMRLHTNIHCFELFFIAIFRLRIRFRDTWLSFTPHRGSHRSFQFLSRFFENFSMFFVVWIDKVNPSQSSSIVELRLLFSPFLLFQILSGFTHFRPNFWPHMIWS